ncbi:hypothetical protein [uncultured Brachyspira sp.]|uniref:hypothetical protein n=1 Tax=uncultured Brachyspira sp. TaxID=221953 RepID=UPI00320959D9
MKNSKKLFLIFLSVLIVAFVSCKKDSGGSITTPTPTFKPSSLVGTWEITGDAQNKFTIGDDGKTSGKVANQNFDFTITGWNKDKEVSQLTETQSTSGVTSVKFTFIFKNVESCTVTVEGSTTETKILNKVKTK